jgi:hypothetical protein
MRHKCNLCVILLAWFAATGIQWDFVQVFAWGRMFAGYAQTMPLSRAVSLTFQPDNLCGLCRIVKDAKQQEGQSGVPQSGSAAGKAPLVFQAAQGVVVARPAVAPWWTSGPVAPETIRAAPQLPPPRAAVA